MTTELHHLLDRAERNVLLVAEGARLRELVGALEADRDFWKRLAQDAREAEERRTRERDEQQTRAVRAEVEVARLTAGQCLDSRAMCEKHHAPPVVGCPYPRCKAARTRAGRAPTA